MRQLLKKQGFAPKLLVTDKLRSYAAAFRRLRPTCPHEQRKRTRQLDSSFGTLHWREMDSNPRFLFAGLGRPHVRSGPRKVGGRSGRFGHSRRTVVAGEIEPEQCAPRLSGG